MLGRESQGFRELLPRPSLCAWLFGGKREGGRENSRRVYDINILFRGKAKLTMSAAFPHRNATSVSSDPKVETTGRHRSSSPQAAQTHTAATPKNQNQNKLKKKPKRTTTGPASFLTGIVLVGLPKISSCNPKALFKASPLLLPLSVPRSLSPSRCYTQRERETHTGYMNGRQEPALPAGMTGAHAAGGCPPRRRGNSSDTAHGVGTGMGCHGHGHGRGMEPGGHRHGHGRDVGLRKYGHGMVRIIE